MAEGKRTGATISDLASHPAARSGGMPRLWRRDAAAAAVISLVASARNVPVDDLLRKSRCRAEIASARQLAMYLVHVKLGRSLTGVGELLGRDRTTVSHACNLMEDRRDDPRFEDEVSRLEAAIDAFADSDAGPATEVFHVAC